MKPTRRNTLKSLGAAASLGMTGCLGSTEESESETTTGTNTSSNSETVRAAFVYHDVIGDFGWQWAHEQARRVIESEFDWLETQIFEKCDPSDSKRRFEQYAKRGFDIIFATSFDYMEPVTNVAPEFPDVKFEHCSGWKQRANVGTYFGRMYQPRYLSGIAAGLLTDNDSLGYVAAFPISEVIRGINAFALGVASVAENAQIQVQYTGTWNDATKERNAAERLIENGVDVIAQHQNYPAAAETASDSGIWALGYNSPMGEIVGENYVTAPIWNWEVFYRTAVTAVYDETWEADFYWGEINSGIVGLSNWGPKVPNSVIETVETERKRLEDGKYTTWDGSKFADWSDEELYKNVNSYVDNVTGKVPE